MPLVQHHQHVSWYAAVLYIRQLDLWNPKAVASGSVVFQVVSLLIQAMIQF
jgi:hypothetical protein